MNQSQQFGPSRYNSREVKVFSTATQQNAANTKSQVEGKFSACWKILSDSEVHFDAHRNFIPFECFFECSMMVKKREIERSNTTFSIPVHTTLLLSIKTIRGTGFETSTKKERKNKVWEIESKEPRMDEENVYTWGKMSKWIETFIKYL